MVQTLVTGGTGFVGAAIVRALQQARESVVVLTRKDPARLPRHLRVPGVRYLQGDIFDSASLQQAMTGCDALINAVQFDNAPFEQPSKGLTYQRIDGDGTECQVAQAKACQIKRMIYISGAGTRAGRTEPWFQAKHRAEQAVINSGMTWTICRPSWIYGPHDRSLNRFAALARFSPIIPIIGSGRETIQPIFVDDVGSVVQQCLNNPASFDRAFDLGGPEQLTLRQVLAHLFHAQNQRRWVVALPKPLMHLIASVTEKIPGFSLTRDAIDFLTMDEKINTHDIKNVLQINLQRIHKALLQYL